MIQIKNEPAFDHELEQLVIQYSNSNKFKSEKFVPDEDTKTTPTTNQRKKPDSQSETKINQLPIRGTQRAWFFDRNYSEAFSAERDINEQAIWCLKRQEEGVNGRTVYYICRYSSCRRKCPAALYLLYHLDASQGVSCFRSEAGHSHSLESVTRKSMKSETKEKIFQLYQAGATKPNEIFDELIKQNIRPPSKEKISAFLRYQKKKEKSWSIKSFPILQLEMSSAAATKKTVFVIYYSMYGHVQTLAREICKGLEKSGVNAKLYQVPETLPQEVLEKMHAPAKAADVPIIKTEQLKEADGYLFGFPTRFGMVPAQMKAFWDTCGQLWMTSALNNKFYGLFFSTGSQHGGQETTAMSSLPFFTHMGMIYVPIGGKHKGLTDSSEIHGGSAWGAGCIATNPTPTKIELEIAEHQGFDFGSVVRRTNFNGSGN